MGDGEEQIKKGVTGGEFVGIREKPVPLRREVERRVK